MIPGVVYQSRWWWPWETYVPKEPEKHFANLEATILYLRGELDLFVKLYDISCKETEKYKKMVDLLQKKDAP